MNELLRRSFRHDAQQIFGAARANKHATFVSHLVFNFGNCGFDDLVVQRRLLVGHANVDEFLGISRHFRSKFGQFLAGLLDDVQKLQRRQHPVTGRVEIKKNNVAGLFAADIVAVFAHLFDDIAVADLSLDGIKVIFGHRFVQTDVAHNGRHDRILLQATAFAHILAADEHDLVAVDDIAELVNRDAAIAVTVESNTDLSPLFNDELGQSFGMSRTNALVDVESVRIRCHRVKFSAEVRKES